MRQRSHPGTDGGRFSQGNGRQIFRRDPGNRHIRPAIGCENFRHRIDIALQGHHGKAFQLGRIEHMIVGDNHTISSQHPGGGIADIMKPRWLRASLL